MKAILRRDGDGYNRIPTAQSIYVDIDAGVKYPCWQPEDLEDYEFSLVILVGTVVHQVNSIDFDFINTH